jgi:GTP-binding protein EngB required for normal cell division
MSRRRRPARSAPLELRLDALNQARELAAGCLPAEELQEAYGVLERASTRRTLSAAHTVVGLFGPTGSGKSSLFNALAGADIARVAARRPTTAEPLAAVLDPAGSAALLDWLQVTRRHVVAPPEGGGDGCAGLILLDLPDFDSTAPGHREIVERLAGQVDVLVWVVDPQKYADAALHYGFLGPMAAYGAVTLVVLNQADRLGAADLPQVTGSLRELLAAEGLAGVSVHAVSARTGEGIDGLRAALMNAVTGRSAATERLAADVSRVATDLARHSVPDILPLPGRRAAILLSEQLATAAGADTVADAVGRSYRMDAHAATGWPVTRWLGKFRPDPLRRLNLRRVDVSPAVSRTSLPEPGPAQRAAVDRALRTYADAAAGSAPQPWRDCIREAALGASADLPDELDQAVAGSDLGAARRSWWWPVAGALQWLMLAVAAAGLAWLGVLAGLAFLQLDSFLGLGLLSEPPLYRGIPLPTLLAVGGAAAGVLMGAVFSPLARLVAGHRKRRARRRLRASVAEAAGRLVAEPAEEQIRRCNSFRDAVRAAQAN